MQNKQTTKQHLKGKFCGIYVRHTVGIPVSIHNSLLEILIIILKEIHEAVKNLQEVESEGLITPDADQSFLLVLQTKQYKVNGCSSMGTQSNASLQHTKHYGMDSHVFSW